MRSLEEGLRLEGRYTLVRRLGAGSATEIWLVADRQTGSRIALKFLVGDAARDARRRDS